MIRSRPVCSENLNLKYNLQKAKSIRLCMTRKFQKKLFIVFSHCLSLSVRIVDSGLEMCKMFSPYCFWKNVNSLQR